MKSIRKFLLCAALAGSLGSASAFGAAEPGALSFADLYRLTVAGPLAETPAAGPLPAAEPREQDEGYAFSVAARLPRAERPPSSFAFSVGALPEPQHWLLVLSGLAAAGWVARRRLGQSL